MPKTKGGMDNRLEALEKNMEGFRKQMEERESNVSTNLELMWKRMAERDERLNQQMEEIRSTLLSLVNRSILDREEDQGEVLGVGSSGVQQDLPTGQNLQGGDRREFEEDERHWIKRKVELPNFDGNDPNGWLARAEKFFEVYAVKPELKVEMAFVSMEGPPVHWFQCLMSKCPNLTWEKLRAELIKRYYG